MNLSIYDMAFFLLFVTGVVAFAMYKSRRKNDSEDYFLAGRSLTWPLIGLSIVAANISTEQMVGMAGQGAGNVGLAVSAWQLTGSIGIVIIAFTLLPRFLSAGIYTMPEFLEYRYNTMARSIMAVLTVLIYVVVLLPAVLFSGGLTLHTIFEIDLRAGVWLIGLIAALYTTWGGLQAVAWADLVQGSALLIGGLLVFALGLNACGGWEAFVELNHERLHVVLPSNNAQLPWTGVMSGMWIVIIYYCGLNQFIVQRNLAAKTLQHGQMGMVFAGALWLLVPFAIVMPGIMALQLYPEELLVTPDKAFPLLVRNLVPVGLRGFIFAAIAGAVISSLASMLNSASTILSMDIYLRLFDKKSTQKRQVIVGRAATIMFVSAGCFIAPILQDPKYGGVFQFIQQFQGYIWPGVVAAFVMAFAMPRAPGSAGVTALIAGPAIYGLFQMFSPVNSQGEPTIHFLIQVALTFAIVCALMIGITLIRPLTEPRKLPAREMDIANSKLAMLIGGLVIGGVVMFVFWFW